ncbi:hypothetical protein [Corallococcus terminator]|uniref:hypothetical protein n=1 Tax=Corallococcus terminator TaxID=2316733 RepID=UPI001FC9F645|nr:hypothetical protein [Corallococcus terminator]
MEHSWKRVVMVSMVVLAVGCRTPAGGLRAAGASDSGNSSAGDSSKSDSGNSSQGNSSQGDSSKSDSGNSSGGDSSRSGSGDSSESGSGDSSGGDSSRSESSGTSEEGSSHSGSSDSSDSTDSDSGNSSESDSGSSREGHASHSESSENSNSDSSKSSQADQGEDSSSRSASSNERGNQLLSTAAVALTVLGLGVVIWQVHEHSERRKGFKPSPQEVGRAAQVYLRARTHQLREDLALGAGPTVEDLAQAARIRRENLDVFGRLLRSHRKELLAMAETKALTPDRAREWLERVGELARTEPRLEEDRQAFLLRQEGEAPSVEVTR